MLGGEADSNDWAGLPAVLGWISRLFLITTNLFQCPLATLVQKSVMIQPHIYEVYILTIALPPGFLPMATLHPTRLHVSLDLLGLLASRLICWNPFHPQHTPTAPGGPLQGDQYCSPAYGASIASYYLTAVRELDSLQNTDSDTKQGFQLLILSSSFAERGRSSLFAGSYL